MRNARHASLVLVLLPLMSCTSAQKEEAPVQKEQQYSGPVTATLRFISRDQADMVGCAAGAFSPDGKKDLHFRLAVDPPSVGDISQIDLGRLGTHSGAWNTGTVNFALGVARVGGKTLLGANGHVIRANEYDKEGLDLFACDDGASAASDSFFVKITLIGGQVHQTPPVTLSGSR